MSYTPPPAPPPSPPAAPASTPPNTHSGSPPSSRVEPPLAEQSQTEAHDPANPMTELPKRRKVQWVGLGESPHGAPVDDSPEGRGEGGTRPAVQHGFGRGNVPHVAISMPDGSPAEPEKWEKEADVSAEGAHINRGYFPPIEDIPHRPGYEADINLPGSTRSGEVTPDSSRPPTPDSDIDIMPGERDGLPTNPNRRPRTFAKEAANLVALHKWKMKAQGRSSGVGEPSSSTGRRLGTAASHNRQMREARDQGQAAMNGGGGGGVLSSLLRLYDHSSAHSSSTTLVDGEISEDESVSGHGTPGGRPFFHRPHPSVASSFTRHRHQSSIGSSHSGEGGASADRRSTEGGRPSKGSSSRTPPLESLARGAQAASRSVRSGVQSLANEVNERLEASERPAAARSKGGVFGALQASAMGLTGVATPVSAKVAPNPTRPGYRLARYSASDVPTISRPASSEVHRVSPSPLTGLTPATSLPGRTNITSSSADDVARLRERHDSVSSTMFSGSDHHNGNGRPASIAGETLKTPPTTYETAPSYFTSQHSSGQRSGTVTPHGTHRRNGSSLNLKALEKALHPHSYHNESAVLKAKRMGTATPSIPGTPDEEGKYGKPIQKPATGIRKRKDKRRQEEIFITMHIAAVLQRQQFILQLTRSLMMFGGPSHRLESQIQSTARVLEIDVQVVLIYSICIFSFQDEATHTSETKFIKQSANVDLGKLLAITTLHWEVVHDKIGVQEASQEISRLMLAKPQYSSWKIVITGALCSAFIGPSAFRASFIDVLVSAPLGAALVAAQLFVASKSDVLSQVFEIVVTSIASFAAAALASTGYFCYTAVISSSIVLILPGWLVCCAALELQSRSIVSGSVRLIWAVIYALFLGLGISIGAQVWRLISGDQVDVNPNGQCIIDRGPEPVPWWRIVVPDLWWLLTVPAYSFFLALRQQTPLFCKEIVVMLVLSCGGWAANHYASAGFPNRSDISSAMGSFVVGFAANIYGKYFQGTAFIVALVPILFQLPSGLSNGGLLNFSVTDSSTDTFTNGFSVAEQLIQVSLGLVIGLFLATVLVHPFGKRRGGLMTF